MDDIELLHSAQIAALQASVAQLVENDKLRSAELKALREENRQLWNAIVGDDGK